MVTTKKIILFNTVCTNNFFSPDVRFMGPDFLYFVISSIDGERDPNNLLLLFRILPQFLRNFPLGHLAEETFDVIACYFPIDFHEVKFFLKI